MGEIRTKAADSGCTAGTINIQSFTMVFLLFGR